jgi:hypothetical protein
MDRVASARREIGPLSDFTVGASGRANEATRPISVEDIEVLPKSIFFAFEVLLRDRRTTLLHLGMCRQGVMHEIAVLPSNVVLCTEMSRALAARTMRNYHAANDCCNQGRKSRSRR